MFVFGLTTCLGAKFCFFYLNNKMEHTILLVQSEADLETRVYSDYETVKECLQGICKMFEDHLKQSNPEECTITYNMLQLFSYLDKWTDLSCLVYDNRTNTYMPYNKEWLKVQIHEFLKQVAGHEK